MDAKQMAYFARVAHLESFSRASEALHVSQPTISKSVKGLEDELGATLLERSTKFVRLTEVGAVVLRYSEAVLATMREMHAEIGDLSSVTKGEVSVGLPPMVGATFFPAILGGFSELHPGVSVALREYGALRVEEEVAAGTLDLGVGLLPVDSKVFEVHQFAAQHLRVVVQPSHSLAARAKVSLPELKDEPFILFSRDFTLNHRIRETCAEAGFEPSVAFESSQWDFISEMAAAGLGVGLLPERICSSLDRARVVSLELVNPSIAWDLGLIWRRGRYLSFAAREFVRFAVISMPTGGGAPRP